MVIVMFIVSMSLSITTFSLPRIELNQFKNDYFSTQLKAMAQFNTNFLTSDFSSNVGSLTFNHWGNVNMAQTIISKKKTYTVQLGTGRLLDE